MQGARVVVSGSSSTWWRAYNSRASLSKASRSPRAPSWGLGNRHFPSRALGLIATALCDGRGVLNTAATRDSGTCDMLRLLLLILLLLLLLVQPLTPATAPC